MCPTISIFCEKAMSTYTWYEPQSFLFHKVEPKLQLPESESRCFLQETDQTNQEMEIKIKCNCSELYRNECADDDTDMDGVFLVRR